MYLATAESGDEEMAEKVRRHREMRGANWHTIEEPLDIGRAIVPIGPLPGGYLLEIQASAALP